MLENANLTPAPSDAAGLNKFVDVIKNMCGVDLESKKEMTSMYSIQKQK